MCINETNRMWKTYPRKEYLGRPPIKQRVLVPYWEKILKGEAAETERGMDLRIYTSEYQYRIGVCGFLRGIKKTV